MPGALLAAVEGERKQSRVCPIRILLADPEYGPDLAGMLPLPKRYPAAAIARGLVRVGVEGNPVTLNGAVKRHRQGRCGCGKATP